MNKKIGIVILATNSYFVLGVRLIKKFAHYYKGSADIKFYFFSDEDPVLYLPKDINVEYHHSKSNSWLDGTNSKFINIMSLENCDRDYLVYFDADTDINKDFTEDWFIGETIGLEHFGNNTWMKEVKGYDRNSQSKAYIPYNTTLPQMYYHGCLFGGRKDKIIKICKILREWQLEDKKIPYEPGVNDESYINAYFHYNPPTHVVHVKDYEFIVSDKGSIEGTRNVNLDVSNIKEVMKNNRERYIDIENGVAIVK